MVEKTCDMNERAFQGLKRKFMHVSVIIRAYFEKNPFVFEKKLKKMVGEDMRHAYTSVAGPETQCSSLCMILLHHILGKIGKV